MKRKRDDEEIWRNREQKIHATGGRQFRIGGINNSNNNKRAEFQNYTPVREMWPKSRGFQFEVFTILVGSIDSLEMLFFRT